MASYGYTSVPGSGRLLTGKNDGSPELEELEAAKAQFIGRWIAGHWLASAVVRSDFVPVLSGVFDRLALKQTAEEQCVFQHLYRVSFGQERNWCRISRRELSTRSGLSDRRLGKALAGLVQKAHIALVSRDRRGTIYRVYLPHEVFKEPDAARVQSPRPRRRPEDTAAAPISPPTRSKPLQSNRVLKSNTVGSLAKRFAELFGAGPGRSQADVIDEILERLADGIAIEGVEKELWQFGKSAPKSTPITQFWLFL